MATQERLRAASLPQMLLIVCLMAWFAGAGTAQKPGAQPQSNAVATQTVAQKIAASQQLLDINTATPDQLTALPGMGAAYAARIIAGRPYTAKNQLAARGILPKEEYERIRALIIAHRPR